MGLRYDPKQVLIEELNKNSNDLLITFQEVFKNNKKLTIKAKESITDIKTLINHIRTTKDPEIDKLVEIALARLLN